MSGIKYGDLEYHSIHRWIMNHHGKATHCSNKNCKGKSKNYNWALKKGFDYKRDITHYIQLCRSCHYFYDFSEDTREKYRKAKIGKTPNNIKPVTLDKKRKFKSITEASIQTGLSVSAIANNLSGLSKRTKIGKWEYHEEQGQ